MQHTDTHTNSNTNIYIYEVCIQKAKWEKKYANGCVRVCLCVFVDVCIDSHVYILYGIRHKI